jgi:hypothetical protein
MELFFILLNRPGNSVARIFPFFSRKNADDLVRNLDEVFNPVTI